MFRLSETSVHILCIQASPALFVASDALWLCEDWGTNDKHGLSCLSPLWDQLWLIVGSFARAIIVAFAAALDYIALSSFAFFCNHSFQ